MLILLKIFLGYFVISLAFVVFWKFYYYNDNFYFWRFVLVGPIVFLIFFTFCLLRVWHVHLWNCKLCKKRLQCLVDEKFVEEKCTYYLEPRDG